jgi:acetoin:2,6-dichlorophenolindophenol oxidoreductase subunit alpha
VPFTARSRRSSRARARAAFLLCETYRFRGHHVGDVSRDYYRTKQEEQRWMAERDPITVMRTYLVERQLAEPDVLERIEAGLAREMDAAMQWAIDAPYPNAGEVAEDVYAP